MRSSVPFLLLLITHAYLATHISPLKMLRTNKRKRWLEDFKAGFHQYLRETTVHGFRYLIDGRNLCEIVVWVIVIAFCFTWTFIGIYTSISESYNNPILTSVQTTQIQKVMLLLNDSLYFQSLVEERCFL